MICGKIEIETEFGTKIHELKKAEAIKMLENGKLFGSVIPEEELGIACLCPECTINDIYDDATDIEFIDKYSSSIADCYYCGKQFKI